MDGIRNEQIRGRPRVRCLADQAPEARLRGFRHFLRKQMHGWSDRGQQASRQQGERGQIKVEEGRRTVITSSPLWRYFTGYIPAGIIQPFSL